jgi:nicotinamidase/pyrazinamidase
VEALIVVDVQNDFCPGGALEVQRGDEVVPFINGIRGKYPLVVFTQDWHPRTHRSFASNNPGQKVGNVIQLGGGSQVMWPDHCVQRTRGAEFHPKLQREPGDPVFRKGEVPEIDSYSGFMDNDHQHETGLRGFLAERKVSGVTMVGLATDYCVKYTVLDALKFGLKVQVLKGGCRAVNLKASDEAQAYTDMQAAGATVQ